MRGPSEVSDPELGAGAPPAVSAGRDNKGKRGQRKSFPLRASRDQRSVSPKACTERGKGPHPGRYLGAPISANPSCGALTLARGGQVTPASPSPRGLANSWSLASLLALQPILLCPAVWKGSGEGGSGRSWGQKRVGLAEAWSKSLGKPGPQASCSNRLRPQHAVAADDSLPGFQKVFLESRGL